jgi:hypothetical protein
MAGSFVGSSVFADLLWQAVRTRNSGIRLEYLFGIPNWDPKNSVEDHRGAVKYFFCDCRAGHSQARLFVP